MFPFGSMDNESTNLTNVDFPAFVGSPPSFEIASGPINVPNLGDYHIDAFTL